MKQWLPTLLLVILFAFGIWYVTANDYFEADDPRGEYDLLSLEKEDITYFEIASESNQVKLQRAVSGWQLADKAGLKLDTSAIDRWLTELVGIVYSEKIVENAADVAPYGLDSPKETYTIQGADKQKMMIKVGNDVLTSGYRYVQLGQVKTVYMVSAEFFTELNKPALDFIVKRPITIDYDVLQRVQVSWRDDKLDLQRTKVGKTRAEHQWVLDGKTTLSQSTVESVMDDVLQWETSALPKSITEYNTTDTIFQLTLTEQRDKQQTVRELIGMPGAEWVPVAEKGKPWVYEFMTDSLHSFVVKLKNQHELKQ